MIPITVYKIYTNIKLFLNYRSQIYFYTTILYHNFGIKFILHFLQHHITNFRMVTNHKSDTNIRMDSSVDNIIKTKLFKPTVILSGIVTMPF